MQWVHRQRALIGRRYKIFLWEHLINWLLLWCWFSTNLTIKQNKIRCCCRGSTTGFRIKRFQKTKISKLLYHLGQLDNFTPEIDFSCWTLGKWCEIHLTKGKSWKAWATSLIRFFMYCFYLCQIYSVALRISVAECCVSLCCCLVFFVVLHCIELLCVALCYAVFTAVW